MIETVSEAITQWVTDGKPNAVIHQEYMTPTQIYRVGSTRTYTTLSAAVAQWNTDSKPVAVIYVDSGTYISISNPSDAHGETGVNIVGSTNRLTIIGEDRDSTIVKSTTGKYIHPAIDIKGGNVIIKNITFIADHSDNANFVYLDPDRPDKPNSAYAIHCDGGSTPGVIGGVIEFENCNIWSWQSCGLGCGTVPNGQVIVRNCDIRSYVNGAASNNGLETGTEEYAEYVHGTRGAIIYHTSPSVSTSHEGFTLINSSVYLRGGLTPMKMSISSNPGGVKMVTFINNTFWNGLGTNNTIAVPSAVSLNRLSSGNNISTINSGGSGYALKIE